MSMFPRLFRRLRQQRIATMPSGFQPKLPPHDHDHEPLLHLFPGERLPAAGQTFIIEYRDAQGQESVRRVTAISIQVNCDGIPAMLADCHERQAIRCFRLDRVEAVYDFDGVLEPIDTFWRDTFGIDWPTIQPPAHPPRDHAASP